MNGSHSDNRVDTKADQTALNKKPDKNENSEIDSVKPTPADFEIGFLYGLVPGNRIDFSWNILIK